MISRQYKLDLMARFLEIKSIKTKLRQDQIAKELGCSSSFLKQNRNDINLLSPHRIPSNTPKRKQKISNRQPDLEKPQML